MAANIVMVDVLHHVEFPLSFLREAQRVLRSGGRIIMVEPAITLGSTLFYRLLHQEPVRTSSDPLTEGTPNPRRDPYDSNEAIPTLIATRDLERFEGAFPSLRIARGRLVLFRNLSTERRFQVLEPDPTAAGTLRLAV